MSTEMYGPQQKESLQECISRIQAETICYMLDKK